MIKKEGAYFRCCGKIPNSVVASRQRGFGLLSISLGISVGLSLMIGGTILYQKADQDSALHDLAISSQFIRAMIAVDAARHADLPEGYFHSIYEINLPGFSKDADGMFHHRWATNVQLRHVGGYVVQMYLDGVDADRCAMIAAHAQDYGDGSYKGFMTINGTYWSDPRAAGASGEMFKACMQGNGNTVGWTFAHSPAAIADMTDLVRADAELEADAPSGPEVPTTPDEDPGSDVPTGGSDPESGPDNGAEPQPDDDASGSRADSDADPSDEPIDEGGCGTAVSGAPGNPNPGTGNCGGSNNGNSGSNAGGNGGGNSGGVNGNHGGSGSGAPGHEATDDTVDHPSAGDDLGGAVNADFTIDDRYLPGGWGGSPGWGPTFTSQWMQTNGATGLVAGETFEISGPGDPTLQTDDGQRAASGTISRWGTNIRMTTPPCGGSATIYIRVGGETIGTWTIERPEWPPSWGGRPAQCDYY